MKRLSLLLPALLLTAGFTAVAQQEPQLNQKQNSEFIDQLKTDVKKLSLTEEQKAPFLEITRKYAEKAKEINADTSRKKIARLKEIKTLRINKDEEMKALLSEEQFKVYQDIRDERKARRRAQ
ncbi:hypothetical protein HYN48_10855 [Flavobacterium magnum]|uniref:DUF4890 domain-containing protein n=1 Tax=Flavobacterium magnum TaxID=2162713 RepID=A0A2S0RH39_9FLAO|nr:hypothetical protein [Flavobacterium magnum]AWA30548.1 hypothetical protein HYN48_10855 [Flavobacterium magnum]